MVMNFLDCLFKWTLSRKMDSWYSIDKGFCLTSWAGVDGNAPIKFNPRTEQTRGQTLLPPRPE